MKEPAPRRRSHLLGFLGSWRGRVVAGGALGVSALLTPAVVLEGPVLCPIRRFLGLECPGCGLTRAIVSLSHGELGAALGYHPFSVFVYAVLALTLLWALVPAQRRPAFGAPGWWQLWRLSGWVVGVSWLGWWGASRLLPALG